MINQLLNEVYFKGRVELGKKWKPNRRQMDLNDIVFENLLALNKSNIIFSFQEVIINSDEKFDEALNSLPLESIETHLLDKILWLHDNCYKRSNNNYYDKLVKLSLTEKCAFLSLDSYLTDRNINTLINKFRDLTK